MLSLCCRLSPLSQTCLLSLADLYKYFSIEGRVGQLQAGGTNIVSFGSILLADG